MQNNICNFTCIECNNHYDNEHDYLSHMQLHWGEVWKCLQCDDKCTLFRSQLSLKEHEGLYHGPDKPFKCFKCELVFDRASQLDYHIRSVHLGEKSQMCQLCGKGFFRKADLKTHLNVHLGTNQCICEFCGRKFNHISNLIRHLRTHEGVKPYPCSICGKRFTQVSSLARHKLIHERTNENETDDDDAINKNKLSKQKPIKRNHYCKTCGDSFRLMTLLKEHENTHNQIIEPIKTYQVLQGSEILDQHNYKLNLQNHCDIDRNKNPNINTENFLERIDTVRDESIDISDILNPYCSELELPATDLMQRENVDPEMTKKFTNLDISTREIRNNNININNMNTCVHIERNQFLIEVCESDYLNNLGLNSMELSDNNNFNNINYCADKSYTQPITIVDKDLNDQWDLQSQVRNDFIGFNHQNDLTAVELKGNAIGNEAIDSTVNSVFDHLKDTSINLLENLQLQPIDQNSESLCGSDGLDAGFHNEETQTQTQTPMVRLVQNEEGEQFFELVRDTVDFESHGNNVHIENENMFSVATNGPVSSSIIGNVRKRRDKPRPRDKIKKKFKCSVCNKLFSTASNLKQHAGVHFSDQQKFQCKECGISFAWKSTLNKHVAGNHRPDGPLKFVCEICPKVYSTLSQVNEHVKRDHLKERNFTCSECGKSFFKKFDLKSHIRTHTNERPYACKTCGKSFHHQSHIIRHERVHSGERPYTCDICRKSFTQPGSLKAHNQRHHLTKVDILDYQIDEDDPLTLNVS
ncbi:zinc finger protein 678-like [Microplitis demolitor]|uniref:zinc finger protein 678-like n=1 Tax=Microplitis demolitor TaxID=69319 RepID=UPI0004CCF797|nr:zinc finger protein 678-like [Microplitis demolitor]